jgi:hypothetical protein
MHGAIIHQHRPCDQPMRFRGQARVPWLVGVAHRTTRSPTWPEQPKGPESRTNPRIRDRHRRSQRRRAPATTARHGRTPWLRVMRRGRKFRTNPRPAGILAIPRWQRNPRRRASTALSRWTPRREGRAVGVSRPARGSAAGQAKTRPEPIPLGRRRHGFRRSHGPAERDVKGRPLILRCRHAGPRDARRPAVGRGAGAACPTFPPAGAQLAQPRT